MFKSILTTAVLTVAGLSFAAGASAHSLVNVNVDGVWVKVRHHRVAQLQMPKRRVAQRVYYSGDYAHVSRRAGATYVYAYPGVRVFVGHGGGVSVSIGF